jgi:hypothetical protein
MRALLALVVLAALAAGGWLAWTRYLAPAETRACKGLVDRCGLSPESANGCEKVVSEVRKASGDEAATRFARCLLEAESCTEAAGCATGLGTAALSRTVLEFVAGLRKAL